MPMHAPFKVQGHIVDVFNRRVFPGTVHIQNGRIHEITPGQVDTPHYILPGFVDAHVHIESSMLVPTEFARLAVAHGTVATVSDPHEIGNVLGIDGVHFMIDNARATPFKFFFGAPSCVPATAFETAGATIGLKEVEELLQSDEVPYLAEMMNFPGVLNRDPEVMAKIAAAHAAQKPVDGHAPGLRGEEAKAYAAAGITTDHECFTLPEALDKAGLGMHILIREGSAAKNFEALHPVLGTHPGQTMFCSDDKHPDSLVLGHLNQLVARAIRHGHDTFDVIRAATCNPVAHYKLPVGLLRPGDPADFIVVSDLENFEVLETYISGECCARDGRSLLPHQPAAHHPNRFHATKIHPADLQVTTPPHTQNPQINLIGVEDGQLVTAALKAQIETLNGHVPASPGQDILKLVVLNRYHPAPPAIAFVKHFDLRQGAIAGSIAHDSHNIIAVGTNDEDIAGAINLVIEAKGGISLHNGTERHVLPLPVAGLMTDADGYATADAYTALDRRAKELGATLASPYMTLSFCALLVIPALKLSDKGLFDGQRFQFLPLFCE